MELAEKGLALHSASGTQYLLADSLCLHTKLHCKRAGSMLPVVGAPRNNRQQHRTHSFMLVEIANILSWQRSWPFSLADCLSSVMNHHCATHWHVTAASKFRLKSGQLPTQCSSASKCSAYMPPPERVCSDQYKYLLAMVKEQLLSCQKFDCRAI